MINFEEELKKYRPSLEIEEAEDAIKSEELDDLSGLVVDLIRQAQEEGSNGGRR